MYGINYAANVIAVIKYPLSSNSQTFSFPGLRPSRVCGRMNEWTDEHNKRSKDDNDEDNDEDNDVDGLTE